MTPEQAAIWIMGDLADKYQLVVSKGNILVWERK